MIPELAEVDADALYPADAPVAATPAHEAVTHGTLFDTVA
jgi:hypothetical protein